MAQHILIVCGYGCHLTPELKIYLDRVISFSNKYEPDCIILCGGFTQRKSAAGISEAGLMSDYIHGKLTYEPDRLILEENSYTTLDNIGNAAVGIEMENLADDQTKLTVFCEATRALKIDLLVRHFFGRRANIETSSWENTSSQKQIVSTLYDWAAIKIPFLALFFRKMRLRRAECI